MNGMDDQHELEDSNILSRRVKLVFFFYLVAIIIFVLTNELWLSAPIADTLTAVIALLTLPVAAGIVWFVRFKQSPRKEQDLPVKPTISKKTGGDPRDRFNQFNLGQRILQGAHRYDAVHDETADFINFFADNLLADGYYFGGTIDNPLNAIMEVYIKGAGPNQEIVFLIETDVFTLEQLMEHRYYFIDFTENLTQTKGRVWSKEFSTVICVREMSAALKILLSYDRFVLYGGDCKTFEQETYWRKAEAAQYQTIIKTVVYVEEEKNLYTGAYRLEVFKDKVTPWLKQYIYGPGYIEPEHVWKDLDWPELFYLDWIDGMVDGAFRYESTHADRQEFSERMIASFTADGYKLAGKIPNDLDVLMSVYVLEYETDYEAVLWLEADSLTMDAFHDHRYLYREFMKKYLVNTELQRERGFRVVVAVKEMSPALQTLLIPWPLFPYKNAAFACAYIEKEKMLYTMKAWLEDGFFEMNETWLARFLPEIGLLQAEHVWNDLGWTDIERLPYTKNEINMMIRKAMNVVRDAESLADKEPKKGTARWGRVRF